MFKNHPFHVNDDKEMEELAESIREHGVLIPGIVRPRAEGGYELIAGHRRKHGSELAGKTEMPVIVRDYSDDEATIMMVDSNIQRETILPSEKAKAYALKYEALKHQGKKSGKSTLDQVGESARENSKKVQRFFILSDSEIANKKSKLQFMRHATKALRCNGFVDGPNSAGSFYALSYYTLL